MNRDEPSEAEAGVGVLGCLLIVSLAFPPLWPLAFAWLLLLFLDRSRK